jgi:serine/threonine protein kinase
MAQPCALCGSPDVDHVCPGDSAKLIGTVLDGRYEIQSILGQGGMGTVFRAVQTSMRREVAIKTLHPSLATSPQFFERFRREAEVCSALRHPNIVTLYDFGRSADGTFYFVMELLKGLSVRQLVREGGLLSLRRAVDIVEQAAMGLSHAHAQGIVHRDIKPHNLLVGELNGFDDVKILDFGLVKALEQEDDEQLTSTGQVLGTPQYMPPEQAGGEAVDERSDLYSLGAVLYYCLTGSSPHGANTVRKALQASLTQKVPSASDKRPGAPVPPALDVFLQRCLAAEKEDRPPSSEAFIDELRAAVEGCSDGDLDARPEGLPPTQREGGSESSTSSRAGARRPGARRATSGIPGTSRPGPPVPSGLSGPQGAASRPGPPVPSGPFDAHPPPQVPSPAPGAAPAPGVARTRPITRTAVPPPSHTGPPRWLLVVVPAALVLLGGGALLWMSTRAAPEFPTPPKVPAPAPLAVRPAAPPPAAEPVPVPAQERPTVVAVPQPPAAPSPVKVHLTSVPTGAEIYDGESLLGTTPVVLKLERERPHSLVFRKDGCVEQRRQFDLARAASDTLDVSVTLSPVVRVQAGRPTATPQPAKKDTDITLFE